MTEIKQVSLESTPAAFQEAVNKQIKMFEDYCSPKILSIRSLTSTPYTDKTIESTTYKAYLEITNTMFVVGYEETTKKEWNDREAWVNSLTIGDVEVLVKNSDWLRDVCKKAIKDVGNLAAK